MRIGSSRPGRLYATIADLAPHRLEERVDDRRGVVEDDPVLGGRALERDARGLGSAPALAVVDAPGVDHDHGRPVRPEPVRHLDDAPGVVGEPPGPDLQVGARVIDQGRRLEPRDLADRLDELRVIRQDRPGLRVGDRLEPVLVDPGRCRRPFPAAGRHRQDRPGRR